MPFIVATHRLHKESSAIKVILLEGSVLHLPADADIASDGHGHNNSNRIPYQSKDTPMIIQNTLYFRL